MEDTRNTSTRKMQLAKYLARDEKNFAENGIKPDMHVIKIGLEVLNEFCIERTGKKIAELPEDKQHEFFTWAEQKTPLEFKPAA